MMVQRAIDTTEELFRKLERTFDRRSGYADHQVDWVFDCAVTAWHLVDWMARELEAGGKSTVRDAQDRLKAKCPELSVCEQVCNGAKHFALDNPKLKAFDVGKNVRATDNLQGISRNIVAGDGKNYDVVLTPQVLITDMEGNCWDAIRLFHTALRFWEQELGLSQN